MKSKEDMEALDESVRYMISVAKGKIGCKFMIYDYDMCDEFKTIGGKKNRYMTEVSFKAFSDGNIDVVIKNDHINFCEGYSLNEYYYKDEKDNMSTLICDVVVCISFCYGRVCDKVLRGIDYNEYDYNRNLNRY